MSSYPQTGIYTGQKRLPNSSAENDAWVDYIRRFANPFSTYRCRHMARATRNLFYYLGRQWIELDRTVMLDGVRGYVFRDLRQSGASGLPHPVTNYIAPAVENEVARLGRKEFQPGIPNTSNDPKVQAAGQIAKDVLQFKLDRLRWPEIRDLFNLTLAITGTAALRSGWDIKITDTVPMPSPTAVQCPDCGSVFSSPKLSEADRERSAPEMPYPERLRGDVVDGDLSFNMTACPYCPEPKPLAPVSLDERAMQGDDRLGRPLSILHPRGDVSLDLPLPWELHLENSGIGIDPHSCRIWGRSLPRSITWLEERWPEHADKYQPESPETLMRLHPLLGEWIYVGRYDSGLDPEIYGDHVIVTELVAEPWVERREDGSWERNNGAVVTMVGGIPWGSGFVVERTDLMIPYEITDTKGAVVDRGKVEKVRYSAARFKPRLGEFWGAAQVDDGVSPQNRVNARDSQFVNTMNRMGSPNVMISEGMELRGPEWVEGYGSGKIMTFTRDPLAPAEKPEVLEGQGLPADAWQERNSMKADMQDIMGAQDVELGEVPRGLKTTSGLLLTGENAAQRRGTRERGIVSAFERTWSHVLHMLYALRTEQETYEVDAKGASMTLVKQFRGADLMKQYNVRISKEAAVDRSLIQSEAAAEALQDQVYDLSDPVARQRYLELRRLPEINDRQRNQITRAKLAAVEYRDDDTVPTFDPEIHAPLIWHSVLGEMWLSDELRERQATAGWDEVVPKIAGWELDLQRLEMQDAAARQFYGITGDQPTPQQLAMANQRYQAESEAQAQQLQQLAATAQQAAQAGVAMPPTPPPPPIPPPVFLPYCLAYRIEIVWSARLGYPIGKLEPSPEEMIASTAGNESPAQVLDSLLQFRAVIEECRLTAIKASGMAPPPPGIAPPPGSVPTPAPSPGNTTGNSIGNAPPTDMSTSVGQMAMPPAVANAVAGGTVPGA